jgi:hypothetical protein
MARSQARSWPKPTISSKKLPPSRFPSAIPSAGAWNIGTKTGVRFWDLSSLDATRIAGITRPGCRILIFHVFGVVRRMTRRAAEICSAIFVAAILARTLRRQNGVVKSSSTTRRTLSGGLRGHQNRPVCSFSGIPAGPQYSSASMIVITRSVTEASDGSGEWWVNVRSK